MIKHSFAIDERGKRHPSSNIYHSCCIITIYSLIAFSAIPAICTQSTLPEEWNDIALIISFNVIVWIGSLLYLSGVVNPKAVKLRYIIIGFTGFVLLGFAFTIIKYSVLLDQTLSMRQIHDYFLTVLKISAILVVFSVGLLASTRKQENRETHKMSQY